MKAGGWKHAGTLTPGFWDPLTLAVGCHGGGIAGCLESLQEELGLALGSSTLVPGPEEPSRVLRPPTGPSASGGACALPRLSR